MTNAEMVSFSLADGELTVRDEAGGGAVTLDVDDGFMMPATDAWFDVPVDDAVSLETSSIEARQATSAQIRRVDGENYGLITDQEFTVHGGAYIDVSAAMKILVYVDGGTMTGHLAGDGHNPESLVVTFDEPTQVVVGARSLHEPPAATMTVTEDPDDLMTAASYLGSSIKEWSAERSWPTLRGHPPAIEVGEERHIPDSLSKPDTEVTVAIPPNTADILRVTPLAHYFGADVVSGEQAELRLGSKYVEPLGTGTALEQSVDDLLGHCLVLDSLVRIGGYYSMSRYEYDELAPELPFYPPELYDEPIHRQLLEYLEVSFETVAPYVPDWTAVGTLRPKVTDMAAVPYLLNTLSRVHVTADGVPGRAASVSGKPVNLSTRLAVPRGVASLPPGGRERGSEHERQSSDGVSVLFVGWDSPEPDQFTAADWDRFELGEDSPSAVYRASVTRAELRTHLTEPYAHIHYGNRVTEEGFVCSDGVLAFESLPDGTVGSLSLNWRQSSLNPLTALFDVASVAYLTDDALPLETAQALAVYLVVGKSVATSARLAGVEDVRFLGDATLSVARRPVGHSPFVCRLERVGTNEYRLSAELDTDEHDALGQVARTRFDKSPDCDQLSGTREVVPEPLSRAELANVLTSDSILRFEWCTTDDEGPSPPPLEELLSE